MTEFKRIKPQLKNAKPGSVAAITACPEVLDWFDPEQNAEIDIASITAGSKTKIHFRCPKCGAPMYREMYRFLTKQPDGTYSVPVCQKCSPTVRRDRVWLPEAVPDIDKYWNYEKNDGHKPAEFSAVSSTKVWTNCPICGTPVRRTVRYTWAPDEQGVGHVIHCRTCGKRTEDNSLMQLFPEITQYWDYSQNEHDPDYYTISSGQRVFLHCPVCTRVRQLHICDAIVKEENGYRLSLCSECAKKQELDIRRQQDSNIAKACPDIDLYWDDRNELNPSDLTLHCLTRIYTHCPTCNKLLNRRAVNTFAENNDGTWRVLQCQKCAALDSARYKAISESGPLLLACPEIKEWWADTNDLSPDMVTHGSHYEAELICPACHAEMRRDIHSFVTMHSDGQLRPVACPVCGYSSKGNPEDNLVAECPNIIEWWDYDANAPFKPEQFTKGSQFMAHLKCPDCGLGLFSGIHSLLHTDEDGKLCISHEGRCRKYRAMSSDNNLVTCYPEVKDWWDYDRNAPYMPEEYTLFSPTRMHFTCPVCGTGTYRRITDAFTVDENEVPTLFKCPYCAGVKPIPGVNSLAALYPELASECISVDDPERILPSATSRVEWRCSTCGGKWFDLVINRVNGAGCPYCDDRKALRGYNTLQVRYPDLIKTEWAELENILIGIDPDNILDTNSEQAWWICTECGRRYMMSTKQRILKLKRGHKPCTFCNGRRPPSPRIIL